MDAKDKKRPLQRAHLDLIRERIARLEEWLVEHGGDCDEEQAHLVAGSRERLYWHCGYLTALRDIQQMAGASPDGMH